MLNRHPTGILFNSTLSADLSAGSLSYMLPERSTRNTRSGLPVGAVKRGTRVSIIAEWSRVGCGSRSASGDERRDVAVVIRRVKSALNAAEGVWSVARALVESKELVFFVEWVPR